MILVFFLLLALQTLAQKPSMKAALDQSMIDTLKKMLIRDITEKIPDTKMLDFEKDIGVAKISVKNIFMHIQPFDAEQLDIELLDGTSDFNLRGRELNLNGTFDMIVRILFTNYNCNGSVTSLNSGFEARIGLIKNGSYLDVNVTGGNITLDKEQFNVTVDGQIKAIINSVITFLKTYFFKAIQDNMGAMLPKMVKNVTDTLFRAIPEDIEVMDGVATRIILPTPPVVKQDFFSVPILSYVHETTNKQPPAYEPPDLPDNNVTCKKGFQLFVSDYVVRSAVETAHRVGLFTFRKRLDISIFEVNVLCTSNSTPSIEFNGKIQFEGKSYCDAEFKLKGDNYKVHLGFIANVKAELSEVLRNFTIYFNIDAMEITELKIISGGVIDLKTLLKYVNMYLDEVRGVINRDIANKGIPIKILPFLDFFDVSETLVGHYIYICASFKFTDRFIKNALGDRPYTPDIIPYY